MKRRPDPRQLSLQFLESLSQLYLSQLTGTERAELHRWESQNLPSEFLSTSDWPGWLRKVPKPSVTERKNQRRVA
jgi:hypothetical protein